MITKNVNRCWASSLFLGLNFEDFDISSGTGSVILVFEDKCAACITGCSTYAGIGFLVFREALRDDDREGEADKYDINRQRINKFARARLGCQNACPAGQELRAIVKAVLVVQYYQYCQQCWLGEI